MTASWFSVTVLMLPRVSGSSPSMLCRLFIELVLLPILLPTLLPTLEVALDTAMEASLLGAREPRRDWTLDWETPTTWSTTISCDPRTFLPLLPDSPPGTSAPRSGSVAGPATPCSPGAP